MCLLAAGCGSGNPGDELVGDDAVDSIDPIDDDPSDPSDPSDDPFPSFVSDAGVGQPPAEQPPAEEPPAEEPPAEQPPAEQPPAEQPPAEQPPAGLGIHSLGALPSELSALAWAERPRITREVTATSAAQITAEAATPGTRIRVSGASGGDVTIAANDVEIIADGSTSLGKIHIGKSLSRIRVEGGRWTGVLVALPANWPDYRPEFMSQDLWFEGMTINAPAYAFEIRGRRIVLAKNDVTAVDYSVWVGDTDTFQSEDLILYDNVFRSAGPQSTVRFVSALRTATVSNVFVNGGKHNYRVHGTSDLNYAADNLLVNTGVMLGTMPGDSLGLCWFDDNVFHQTAPDLFNPSTTAVRTLRARRNVVYDNGHSSFLGDRAGTAGWEITDNTVFPYQPPPAY
jgi:hypothetical protein